MAYYPRFIAMVVASTVIMFGLMHPNTYQLDHVFFSETRADMALVLGATTPVVMLALMTHMLKNRSANLGIAVVSALVFAGSLWLVCSQVTVDDVWYVKAIISHHSVAIMTSRRDQITDPRVRKLADGIAETQVREIAEMKQYTVDLESQR